MAKKSAPAKKTAAKPAKGKGMTAEAHRTRAEQFRAMADIHHAKARMMEAGTKKKDPYNY